MQVTHCPSHNPCSSISCNTFSLGRPSIAKCTELFRRIAKDWQGLLMDGSIIISMTGASLAVLTGSYLVAAAFCFTTITSIVGSIYMHRLASLSSLQESSKKFETLAGDLEKTNRELSAANLELRHNNTIFQESNQRLIQTNTQLSLQVTQLRQSAEKIRTEVTRFAQESQHLSGNVQSLNETLHLLDDQINMSQALCQEVVKHFAEHERDLKDNLRRLEEYLLELRASGSVHEKIQQLATLQEQSRQELNRLHEIQLQSATERGHLQSVHEALLQLKEQFDSSLREANSDFRSNNLELGRHIEHIRTLIRV